MAAPCINIQGVKRACLRGYRPHRKRSFKNYYREASLL